MGIHAVRRQGRCRIGKKQNRPRHKTQEQIQIQRDAVGALADIVDKGNQRALDTVAPLLVHADLEVRCSAFDALTKIVDEGDQRVLSAFVPLLNATDPEVRRLAVIGFRSIAGKDGKYPAIWAWAPLSMSLT